MKYRFSLSLVLLLAPLIIVQSQDDVNLFDFWQYYSDAENALYKYFCSAAFQQLAERRKAVDHLQSAGDWIERQAYVRDKLLGIMGPFPEKTPSYKL